MISPVALLFLLSSFHLFFLPFIFSFCPSSFLSSCPILASWPLQNFLLHQVIFQGHAHPRDNSDIVVVECRYDVGLVHVLHRQLSSRLEGRKVKTWSKLYLLSAGWKVVCARVVDCDRVRLDTGGFSHYTWGGKFRNHPRDRTRDRLNCTWGCSWSSCWFSFDFFQVYRVHV